ncbi:unnamed protein product [Pseudo-nitzschia multistriata]|uniref:RxLR effector protein n=1 Tax=Pseudo-nitzschia multistriata TaxID=183589 RepID=A0A448YZ39_9STRA|nr:unnamed protein product [Pseudo-nitzschia multistriata]
MRKTALLSFAVIAFISHKHVTYVNALNYDVLRGSISTTKIHDSGHRRQLPEAYEGEPSHKEKSDGSDKQDKTDRNKVEYPSSSPSALPDKEDKLDRKKVEFPTSSPSVPPPPDWARPWNTASPTSLPPKWARPWNTASPTAMKTTNAPISTGTPSSNREVASTITPSFKSSPLLDPTSHVEPSNSYPNNNLTDERTSYPHDGIQNTNSYFEAIS